MDNKLPSAIVKNTKTDVSTKFKLPGDTIPTIKVQKEINNKLLELNKTNKSVNKPKSSSFIYLDSDSQDKLKGYSIGVDGNLYNEFGEMVTDGYNQIKKCNEDVIRKKSRLPEIGNEQAWKRARVDKVNTMKRTLYDMCENEPTE
jgi:hypothetical protein